VVAFRSITESGEWAEMTVLRCSSRPDLKYCPFKRIGSVATGGEGDATPHLQSQGSVTLTGAGQYLLATT
jgi:hypothetical protein